MIEEVGLLLSDYSRKWHRIWWSPFGAPFAQCMPNRRIDDEWTATKGSDEVPSEDLCRRCYR